VRITDWEPIALEDVPPIVFSEAMRHVDRLVRKVSIAAAPTWRDRGGGPLRPYWDERFGELTDTATRRRDILAELVPQLHIADRCELADRFLVVRGELRTYKIHLDSANVLMTPDDEQLCILPRHDERRTTDILLPFESDHRLSEIVSKAVLLAADTKIRDKTITRQIRRAWH
jgi:hypothetical protein